MNKLVEVREYESLTGSEECKDNNQYKYLPEPAFSQLVNFVEEFVGNDEHSDAMDFMRVYRSKNRRAGTLVSVNKYVGLIELKSGYQIQILPKIDMASNTKKIFMDMLKSLKDFPGKVSTSASLSVKRMNIYEIFISMYLDDVKVLVKHGIKSSYVVQEDNLKFYKGKLLINQHIKNNLAHKERFYIAYDEFLPDRPENRIIKSTLLKLQRITASSKNSKDIKQLLINFEIVNESTNFTRDLSRVQVERNTKDYELLLQWSKVFLFNKSFSTFSGNTQARALLFPMDKLFESYVAQQVKKIFRPLGWKVLTQDKRYYLFTDESEEKNRNIFRLKPDIVLRKENLIVIMDTKWKRLVPNRKKNYGITSEDMYQMYAYSKRYSNEKMTPHVWLIYPKTEEMEKPLLFESGDGVVVHAFFIDLENILFSLTELKELIEKSFSQ